MAARKKKLAAFGLNNSEIQLNVKVLSEEFSLLKIYRIAAPETPILKDQAIAFRRPLLRNCLELLIPTKDIPRA